MSKKIVLQKMGIKKMTRQKQEGTLTQRERYLKKKKAKEDFKKWFRFSE